MQGRFFILCFLYSTITLHAQQNKTFFHQVKLEETNVTYYELLVSKKGELLATTSFIFCTLKGDELNFFWMEKEKKYGIRHEKNIFPESEQDTIKTFAESKNGFIFFATHDNQILYEDSSGEKCDFPPFYNPVQARSQTISKLWVEADDNLFIGTRDAAFYFIANAASPNTLNPKNYKIVASKDSSLLIVKGEIPVRAIHLAPGIIVNCFAQDIQNKDIVWIGTNRGVYRYQKNTDSVSSLLPADALKGRPLTITHIEPQKNGSLWMSTLERGMAYYYEPLKKMTFYSYPKKAGADTATHPINMFSAKTADEFFVAIADSVPAIFNINSRAYKFIQDSSFKASKNSTTDIKADMAGNLYLIKGGALYACSTFDDVELAATNSNPTAFAPFFSAATFLDGQEIASLDYKPKDLEKLILPYNKNAFVVYFKVNYSSNKQQVQFAWKMDGYRDEWMAISGLMNSDDSAFVAYIRDIKPGKYALQLKVKVGAGDWSPQQARMMIVITPPFWQTWWFWIAIIIVISALVSIFLWWRINVVKRREREKFQHEKQILELESMALRAQMNPHFIFNCLNSIKALVQQNKEEKSVLYLTTFSKLIRTLFNNADKKEISLHDEIETCELYLQLEAMRFDDRFSYNVQVQADLDLKSVFLPALIIQPFVENAIWHGVLPKAEGGHVSITVQEKNNAIEIVIEDDGIGRVQSQANKPPGGTKHESRGVQLTQSRLKLHNLLKERNAILTIIDKNDPGVSGTQVIIRLPEET